jgi:hypothetical protein
MYNIDMRKAIFLALLIILAFTLFSTAGQRVIFAAQWWALSTFADYDGLYSARLQEYYCTNERSCKHEEGHKEDHLLGWYSDTPEFDHAINILEDCNEGLSQLPFIQFVLRGERDANYELYAYLYETVELGDYNSLAELMTDYVGKCE